MKERRNGCLGGNKYMVSIGWVCFLGFSVEIVLYTEIVVV